MMQSVAPRGLGAALRGGAVRARPSCALRAAADDERATASLQARARTRARPPPDARSGSAPRCALLQPRRAGCDGRRRRPRP